MTTTGEARGYGCDVADPAAVQGTFASVDSDLGPVEVLVNNAGIGHRDREAQERFLGNVQAALMGLAGAPA